MNPLQSDVLRIAARLNISFLISDVTGKLVGYPITQPTPLLFLWMELWKPRTLFPQETVKWTVESLKEKGHLELQPRMLFLPPGVYSHRTLNGTEWTIEAIAPDEILPLGNGESITLPGFHTFVFACPTGLVDKFRAARKNDKHFNFVNYFSFTGIGCKGDEHPHFALTEPGRENVNLSAEDLLSINLVGPGPKAAAEPVKPAVGDRAGGPGTNPEPMDGRRLPPSRVKAAAVYEWAIEVIPDADKMPLRDLFQAVLERLDAEISEKPPGAGELEKLQELRNSLPDNAETFGKYVRDAGIKRYNTRGERVQRISHFKQRDQLQ